VLVASPRGHSRGPAVAAAYLVLRKGVSLRDALARVRRARPTSRINAGFFEALQRLEPAPTVTLAEYRRTHVRLWQGGGGGTSSDDSDGPD
jgi:hypothetical protein